MRHSAFHLLLVLAALSGVTGPSAATDGFSPKIDQALVADVENGAERLRVVVRLAAPPEARLKPGPPGVEFPRARLETVESVLTQELGELAESSELTGVDVDTVFRIYPGYSAIVGPEELTALAAREAVVAIDKDVVWHRHTGEGVPLINADALHDLGITGSGTAVAIIDSGVDYQHPTLGGGPIPNGVVVYGKDTGDNDDDPMDCDGHGTAVASIAAGRPHEFSALRSFAGGVAPDAKILAYKASTEDSCGSFVSSHVVAAIEDVILHRDDYNVVAINLSIGGGWFATPCDTRSGFYASAFDDATEAGIAVVVSSGNEAEKEKLASPSCLTNAISVASVYDEYVGVPGYSYCGNDDCTEILCTDGDVPAKTVTCYSNTNAFLDLYAPSEELTAARYNASTTDFGGTSGAAPYITGSIALLAQAFPGIDPTQARLLLGLTGEPIVDPANLTVRPLADLETALSTTHHGVGDGVRQTIPDATGEAAVSTAVITADGFVDSVRVMVKVSHPEPEDLVVTLQSPDGTRVTLHDHGVGTTDPEATGVLSGEDGLYATYPDDRDSVEPLSGFSGLEAAGPWTLEVVDDVSTIGSGLDPVLVGWGLHVETSQAPDPPSGSSFFIPVGIHAPGAEGTFWVTDTRILNPSYTGTSSLKLYLIPAGSDGTVEFDQTNVQLPPRTIVSLPDIVSERFGRSDVQGNLLFQTESDELLATSRTYNTGGTTGTYGQFIGMSAAAESIGVGDDPLYLIQLSNQGFRTNIGFSETGGIATDVTVRLYDGVTGNQIGTTGSYTVPPFSNLQENRIFDKLGAGSSANAFAVVSAVGGGRLTAYASVVDEETGDAIYIPGRHPAGGDVILPISAKQSGAAQTDWVTDLRVLNAGAATATVDIEFRPETDTAGSFQTLARSIGGGRVLAMDDVLGDGFGLGNTSGSLRIAPRGGAPLVVTSRTYNQTIAGTYGQFIGGVRGGYASGESAVVFHMDKGNGFRSNVGICETSGAPVDVRYALKDSEGTTVGTGSVSLDPFQVDQINDVYGEVGASAAENTRLDLYHDGGDGSFTAYGSVVDNDSGDAIFIPAMPLP